MYSVYFKYFVWFCIIFSAWEELFLKRSINSDIYLSYRISIDFSGIIWLAVLSRKSSFATVKFFNTLENETDGINCKSIVENGKNQS